MINVKQQLLAGSNKSSAREKAVAQWLACLDCSSVISSDAFMAFSVISLIDGDTHDISKDTEKLTDILYSPLDNTSPSLPFGAPLEPCVSSH